MSADVLDVLNGLDCVVGGPITRSAIKARAPAVGAAWRAAWSWVSLAIVAAGVSALALKLLSSPVSILSSSLRATTELPASLYFDSGHTAVDADQQAIAAIASAVRGSSTPVVVAGYADRSGNRDQNLRLAQKHATDVRAALVKAGVPTLRVVVVSPTFVAANDARRVEVSLVHAVRAFPAQPVAKAR